MTAAGRRAGVATTACCLAFAGVGSALATAATAAPVVGAELPVATASATSASLSNSAIARTWSLSPSGVLTTSLRSPVSGSEWSSGSSPDFLITVDQVPTTSTSGWSLVSATAGPIPVDPSRPDARPGSQVSFRYAFGTPAALATGLELDRTVTLREGSSVFETTSTLVSHGASARIGQWSLDELTPAPGQVSDGAQVLGYSGGTDWRDDYKHSLTEIGSFDDEGETARFDNGSGAGWFLVSARRGGAASRAGRDSNGRTWIGVDPGRDVFDFGPLRSSPPDYNRLENPAYPAPIRERVLAPLGTLDLGTGFLGVYGDGFDRGEAGAAAAFVDDFASSVAPQFPLTIGQNSFHPWNHGAGMSDPNLRGQIDAASALGITTYMLDDQWQGGTGGESGDWHFDPARFPDSNADGVPDFVDYLHGKGMTLGLWMSIAEFNTASTTYAAHPDWACAPTGDVTAQIPDDAGLGVWDMNNPDLRAYLSGVVDRLIADDHVTEFKFDFQAWLDCGTHDYNDYEDAFVAFVHGLQRSHPDVTFELDETNDQRAWPFESAAIGPSWFDNGHVHAGTSVTKILHDYWSAAPWLPTASIGLGSFDGTLDDTCGSASCSAGYLAPLMLLGHATFWTDTTALPADARTEIAWWSRWYASNRQDLRSVVYEDTPGDPLPGTGVTVLQPWQGDAGELFAFRQSGGDALTTISVQGVRPTETYRITDVRTGQVLGDHTGAELRAGYPVELDNEWSARVLRIAPADSSTPLPEAGTPVLLLLPPAAVAFLVIRRRRRS